MEPTRTSLRRPTFSVFGILPILTGLLFAAPNLLAQSQVLYQTDFETFPVGGGPNKLIGIDGWVGTGVGTSSAAGIDQDVGGGTGRSGYIGYLPPQAGVRFVSVRRPVNFNPITAAKPIVEFTAIIGVSDSTNAKKDRFYFTVYNSTLQALAWLNFDNSTTDHFIYRYDGVTSTNTGGYFLGGTTQFLSIKINYLTNRWTVLLDFSPLFVDAPFHAGTRNKDMGSVAVEWSIVDSLGIPGNNWMFFDEWNLTATVEDKPALDAFTKAPAGSSLSWWGELGYSYRVEYSNNLGSWIDSLPNSLLTPTGSSQTLHFTDAAAPAGKRYYRIKRFVATP